MRDVLLVVQLVEQRDRGRGRRGVVLPEMVVGMLVVLVWHHGLHRGVRVRMRVWMRVRVRVRMRVQPYERDRRGSRCRCHGGQRQHVLRRAQLLGQSPRLHGRDPVRVCGRHLMVHDYHEDSGGGDCDGGDGGGGGGGSDNGDGCGARRFASVRSVSVSIGSATARLPRYGCYCSAVPRSFSTRPLSRPSVRGPEKHHKSIVINIAIECQYLLLIA